MRVPRQGDLRADSEPGTQLEGSDCLSRLGDERLLPGDLREIRDSSVHHLAVATASPTPMLMVILVMRGTCIAFSILRSVLKRGTTVSR